MNAAAQQNRHLRLRLRKVARVERGNWAMGLAATATAVPVALVWSDDSLVRALGVGYVLFYAGLMVLPTALEALLLYDAVRVLTRRSSIVLPWVAAQLEITRRRIPPGQRKKSHWLVRWGSFASPLGVLQREAWGLAARFNPAGIDEAVRACHAIAKAAAADGPNIPSNVITIERRVIPPEFTDRWFNGPQLTPAV